MFEVTCLFGLSRVTHYNAGLWSTLKRHDPFDLWKIRRLLPLALRRVPTAKTSHRILGKAVNCDHDNQPIDVTHTYVCTHICTYEKLTRYIGGSKLYSNTELQLIYNFRNKDWARILSQYTLTLWFYWYLHKSSNHHCFRCYFKCCTISNINFLRQNNWYIFVSGEGKSK